MRLFEFRFARRKEEAGRGVARARRGGRPAWTQWRRYAANEGGYEIPEVDATGLPKKTRTWGDCIPEPNATKSQIDQK
jgi:hypothetical protein